MSNDLISVTSGRTYRHTYRKWVLNVPSDVKIMFCICILYQLVANVELINTSMQPNSSCIINIFYFERPILKFPSLVDFLTFVNHNEKFLFCTYIFTLSMDKIFLQINQVACLELILME